MSNSAPVDELNTTPARDLSSSPDTALADDMETSSETGGSYSSDSYLTLSDELHSMNNVADLQDAVLRCKDIIIELPDNNPDKKSLVRRLIELRKRLHDLEEALRDEVPTSTIQETHIVLGHHFQKHFYPKSIATDYCDRCSGLIWNALHSYYMCTDCKYKCHDYCLKQVCRICAHVVVSETPSYVVEICPEATDGMAAQNYRCAECLSKTSLTSTPGMLGFSLLPTIPLPGSLGASVLPPRRCDYNGKYYCPTCHWNSSSVIPARVIQNWDFSKRPVCRATKQHLQLLNNLPIVSLETLNPLLFASIERLGDVKKFRQRLLLMKKYLTSCKIALESNLVWQLKERLHFLESDDKYSLRDLEDVHSGGLLVDLEKLMQIFSKHITEDCQICKGQGFFCEFCSNIRDVPAKIIFPFQDNVICCPVCGFAYHVPCWLGNSEKCPKCIRLSKRTSDLEII